MIVAVIEEAEMSVMCANVPKNFSAFTISDALTCNIKLDISTQHNNTIIVM